MISSEAAAVLGDFAVLRSLLSGSGQPPAGLDVDACLAIVSRVHLVPRATYEGPTFHELAMSAATAATAPQQRDAYRAAFAARDSANLGYLRLRHLRSWLTSAAVDAGSGLVAYYGASTLGQLLELYIFRIQASLPVSYTHLTLPTIYSV